MKTKNILITLITILAVIALVFQSCKKNEEESNQPPTCKIVAPTNNQSYEIGDTVTISVEAIDGDGFITEVRFAIDGVGKDSTSSYPFNYIWSTNYEDVGSHIIKVTSIDNEGGSSSDEITIEVIVPPGTLLDRRDGQIYAIVDIGSQTWMAENLNYETSNSWWYDNSSANGDVYGRFYTWDAAMNGESSSNSVPSGVQGICPDGWHLPSDAEWTIFTDYLGGENVAGEKMKSTSGWNHNGNGTNSSGFNAFPGGYRTYFGTFYSIGYLSSWWSSSEDSGTIAWHWYLNYKQSQMYRDTDDKRTGYSVRCIKD